MAIPTSLAGMTLEPMVHEVDERWTMAYAAALGDSRPAYLDTTRPAGVVAHPLFTVCPEWPVIVNSRRLSEQAGVSAAEVRTGVHATHDVVIHRLIRPGDVLTTSLEMVGLVDISPGAMSTTRLQTVDATGAPISTTSQNGIYLGVHADGEDRPDPDPPTAIPGQDRIGDPREVTIDLDGGAAHTYTECARIWNPIHTDRAVALAAGLPDIILHGTANLAYGVTAVVDHRADGRPELIRRLACRFKAMVLLPSTITVRVWPPNETGAGRRTVPFEVLNADGQPAVQDGLAVLGEPEQRG
ncbi:MAG: MaoC/PaaZ C-terminal domain-containing protein [Acidimicrobiales bacterium]